MPPSKRFECGEPGCQFLADTLHRLNIHLGMKAHRAENSAAPEEESILPAPNIPPKPEVFT